MKAKSQKNFSRLCVWGHDKVNFSKKCIQSESESEKPKNLARLCVWGHERVAAEVGCTNFSLLFLSFYPAHNDKGFQMVGKILHHPLMMMMMMTMMMTWWWWRRLPLGSVSGKGGSFSLPPSPVPCQSTPACLLIILLLFLLLLLSLSLSIHTGVSVKQQNFKSIINIQIK